MIRFTQEQHLLLSTLIYFDDVVTNNNLTLAQIVGKIQRNIDTKGWQYYKKNEELPCLMNETEWEECFRSVLKNQNPQLKDLKLQNATDHSTGYPDDFRAACFVSKPADNPEDVLIVFRGTAGTEAQWKDNFEGVYIDHTKYQESARKYVESLNYLEASNISITGHSKGGNMAMYATIFSDKIDHCLSFDGQGFSGDFISENTEAIKKSKNKILAINAQKDFVSLCLIGIAGATIWYKTEEQKGLFDYHKPNIISGRMTPENECEPSFEQQKLKLLISEVSKRFHEAPLPIQNSVVSLLAKSIVGGPKFFKELKKICENFNKLIPSSALNKLIAWLNDYIENSIVKSKNFKSQTNASNVIKVDTQKLLFIVDTLTKTQNKVKKNYWNLEEIRRKDPVSLASKIILGSSNEFTPSGSPKIQNNINYLKNTINLLEQCENKILQEANAIGS